MVAPPQVFCFYLADSLFFPLYMVVGLFGQIISLNMLKLHGGDQNYSPETNLPSHQGSLVLQVKTNVEINPMDDLFL